MNLEKMRYLITCAGSKNKPVKPFKSDLKALSFNEELHEGRKEIIDLAEIKLDWNYTLPAWQLYSGNRSKLYPKITKTNWEKGCVNILILSALFGWIKHTDNLPYYDLRMTDKLQANKKSVWQFWFKKTDKLKNIITTSDIDLLSTSYRKAINGKTDPVALEPKIKFTDYGTQKGIWLNNEIEKIIC